MYGFRQWGYPITGWFFICFSSCKIHFFEMDDDMGCPYFRKPSMMKGHMKKESEFGSETGD